MAAHKTLTTECYPVHSAEARFPGIVSTSDGSGPVVWVESHISQGACAYPITPSTPMGDGYGVEYANGSRNLWDEPVELFEPESEHSSASVCEGFALAGGHVVSGCGCSGQAR